MGISHSTARVLAPASFLLNFAAQQYGMLISKPNMLDVHNANPSFFSPQPFFIAGFFAPQQVFQVVWLWKLWTITRPNDVKKTLKEEKEVQDMVDYAPWYTLGNLCIGAWMVFWNASDLKAANLFVTINSLSQLYYISTRLPPLNTSSTPSLLTHIVSKTFAGIGVLDLLHNTSVAFFPNHSATLGIKVATGLGFGVASAMSDWIFGGCLVYDLVAMSVGQGGDWGALLGWFAAGSGAIVAAKNLIRPPYVNDGSKGYTEVNADERV